MRNFVTLVILAVIGYFAFNAIWGGGDEPDSSGDGRPKISGVVPDDGNDVPNSAAILEGGSPGEIPQATPEPASSDEDEAKPVPAVGEIANLERALSGTVSPERDADRFRLAEAYRRAGRGSDADRTFEEIYRGGGDLAPRAAVALLETSQGSIRAELASYVVGKGPEAPGYGVAALIHGQNLAKATEESDQMKAWRLLSEAYFSRPEESWRAPIRQVLEPLAEKWFLSRRPSSLTASYSVVGGDSLDRIAIDHGVTVDQLRIINGIEGSLIHPGDRFKVLDRPIRVEIDKSEYRLDVKYDGGFLMSFPVGHGADGRTPIAEFTVKIRQEHPDWFPPNRPRVEYGDPGNPLGERWLGFASQDGYRGFGIHGTNQPETIGTEASEGCVRLRNEDVIRLYPFIAVGTKVEISE